VIAPPALALLLALAGPLPVAGTHAVVAARAVVAASDSLRPRAGSRIARHRRTSAPMGTTVAGYLSSRGLPPRAGRFALTDSGLVFRSADGRIQETYPVVGPVRSANGRRWRAPAVSLAYLDQDAGRTLYVFRLDGGVFQTDVPGALLDVVDRAAWVDSLASPGWQADRPLAAAGDNGQIRRVTGRIVGGAYADTLYALFGRPHRAVGQVGERGRRLGRLGEYLAQPDSLALDPTRIASEEQLRHTLAHELGHRWQARAPGQLAVLWQGIPPIRDPKRYGHGSVTEHQAEAIAFAVDFLQATAGVVPGPDHDSLLEQYERMVPGTASMVRYLALQAVYADHPLRARLTRGGAG
jgi:hypothetical protein